jgi:N-acetyl-gamma-glutamyl-phosphate reductase
MTTTTVPSAAKSSASSKPHALKGKVPAIFIDGEAGTTGLEIRRRLAGVDNIDVLGIPSELRKDDRARLQRMKAADLIVLCLPDDAAKQAVALAATLGDEAPRIVDASTAHRVAPGWVFGFPELEKGQAEKIAAARHVTNPGCYSTGAIALIKPLSGYSGGGKAMIEAYEAGTAPLFELYGLGLEHKHMAEIIARTGLATRPVFVPSVGNYRQGMLVSVPLHLGTIPGAPKAKDLEAVYAAHYKGAKLVKVIPADDASSKGGRLDALALNDSDVLEIRVFGNEKYGQAVLIARLDNLGKGASGAAVQNIRLMLGLDG